MSEHTGIAWADATVNFWQGCSEVSPGCDHCYARTLAEKFGTAEWGPKAPRVRGKGAVALAHRLNRKALKTGRRLRVFTNSMSDFFDNQVDPLWRQLAWQTIAACDALDWLILTKRPQNIAAMLPEGWGEGWRHVWLVVSAENQQEADRRIPVLLQTPAALRGVSFEPLLEHIVIRPDWLRYVGVADTLDGIDWAVIGGESGVGRRDCGVEHIVHLAGQCVRAGIPVFVKQASAFKPDQQGRIPDAWFIREWPASPLRAA